MALKHYLIMQDAGHQVYRFNNGYGASVTTRDNKTFTLAILEYKNTLEDVYYLSDKFGLSPLTYGLSQEGRDNLLNDIKQLPRKPGHFAAHVIPWVVAIIFGLSLVLYSYVI